MFNEDNYLSVTHYDKEMRDNLPSHEYPAQFVKVTDKVTLTREISKLLTQVSLVVLIVSYAFKWDLSIPLKLVFTSLTAWACSFAIARELEPSTRSMIDFYKNEKAQEKVAKLPKSEFLD